MDLFYTLLDTCTTLTRRFEHLEQDKIAQAIEITKLKQRVKKLERRNKGRMVAEMDADADVVLEKDKDVAANIVKDVQDKEEIKPAEFQEVVGIVTTAKIITEVVTSASDSITAANKAFARDLEAELNINIDWDEVINHVHKKAKEDPAVKRYRALKRKPQNEAQARKNIMIYLKNVTKEQINEEESRALKRLNKTQAEKAAKRQKLDKEVPVVDYEIYNEHNKPYYKIKHADGSHKLYLSFLSMLRNFDREDLEALWRLVKERFATTKPKNFSNDFLLTTLGAIFGVNAAEDIEGKHAKCLMLPSQVNDVDVISFDDEASDKEDTSKHEIIDEIDADEYIILVSTHDDVSTQDNIVQNKGIEDVVSDVETIVITALTITAESTKINVEVTQAPKRKGVMIQELEETITTTKTSSSQQPYIQDKEKRRKFFAAKRAKEKRNKPPTKAQQRNIMCNYLKNMEGWKPKSLKNKSFAKIQKLFDKAMKRVNTFVDYKTELVVEGSKKDEVTEGSLKRTGDELKKEIAKKQKIIDDKETTNLKQLVKIILKDNIVIDDTPLAVKSLMVD
uniref:Uncharacterized protein n=1 Tax=Tanacetum cinerariifolium TaxID=118510 RepID=A0A6L2NY54_TANCI|nr:hypothetical protein [Tanacetum cinerariifolium]